MTNPWGSQPPKTSGPFGSKPARRNILAAGIVVIMAATVGPTLYERYADNPRLSDERMPTAAYETLTKMAEYCPVTKGPIRKLMADGYLTKREAYSLASFALARQKAYFEVAARAEAAKAAGAPRIPVPPKCEGVKLTIFEGFGESFVE